MQITTRMLSWLASLCVLATWGAEPTDRSPGVRPLERVRISRDGRHFVRMPSGLVFKAWGFNYDHDSSNRLLETYWVPEWQTVVSDFEEMKALGANTVRIHLQVAHFMNSPTQPNTDSLSQLARVVDLAERTGLYLDVTGLGCYDKKEVPKWYNDLGETDRWNVQARFWEAVAQTCHQSPAIFCFDLMNEPVVTEDKKGRDWTPGVFADRYFVQRLTLDFKGRTPQQIARAWVEKMAAAVRQHDPRALITVGAIPWALTWPNAKPLIYSKAVRRKLDFVAVHFYPKNGEVDKALEALAVYSIGKPLVIEEIFPLSCSVSELDRFIDGSKPITSGWLGFYWGKTIAEYKAQKGSIADGMALGWLEYFAQKTTNITGQVTTPLGR